MKDNIWKAFGVFWILNSLLLYFANLVYPANFIFGTYNMGFLSSIVVAGFAWTLMVWVSDPIVSMVTKLDGRVIKFGFYFLVNFLALWLTARLAPITGFGVTSFVWLAILAIFADMAQYIAWKSGNFEKPKKKGKRK